MKKDLVQRIADFSGQKYEKVYADCDRNYWMTAQEAKAYGIIDDIITKKK
jgi:ATP-dependent Clp protease protease subunit